MGDKRCQNCRFYDGHNCVRNPADVRFRIPQDVCWLFEIRPDVHKAVEPDSQREG
jgi:hypothetical protein